MSIMRHLDRVFVYPRAVAFVLATSATFALNGCDNDAVNPLPTDNPCDTVTCGDHAQCVKASGLCACDDGYQDVNGTCVADTASCDEVVCGDHATCDATTSECQCVAGYEDVGGDCLPIVCSADSDCDDGLACNGAEVCDTSARRCLSSAAVACDANAQCEEPSGDCVCAPGSVDHGQGCVPTACESDAACDDGNACNGTESCDLTSYTCAAGTDRVVCTTRNSICAPDSGDCQCASGYVLGSGGDCVRPGCANDADCDDGIVCNGAETCNLSTETCVGGMRIACPNNANCLEDDAKVDPTAACECKQGFTLSQTGTCVAAARGCTDDDDCSTNRCFGAQTCDTDAGLCVARTPCGTRALCDPLAPTDDALCACPPGYEGDPTDVCTVISCASNADCDDGVFCNGEEICQANGKCMVTGPAFLGAHVCNAPHTACDETTQACACTDGFVAVDGLCVPRVCAVDTDCDDGMLCNGTERCDLAANACVSANDPVACGIHEVCDPKNGACLCDATFKRDGETCAPIDCAMHSDCDDGRACNGVERCDAATGVCARGAAIDCGADGACIDDAGDSWCDCPTGQSLVDGQCAVACPVPQAPVMTLIRRDTVLPFTAPAGYAIEIAELGGSEDITNAGWMSASSVDLSLARHDDLRIVARTRGNDCVAVHTFDWTYSVVDAYPGLPVIGGKYDLQSNVIPAYIPNANGAVGTGNPLNTRIEQWISGVARIVYGTAVDANWRVPEKIYGPALGTMGIVVLGNQGRVDVTFDRPITNGVGPDFAVYENGFGSGTSMVFAEIAFTEVSSDGLNFVRFDQHCLQNGNPGAYGTLSMNSFNNVAGTAPALWGTPFDLEELRNRAEVLDGTLNLQAITHVRIIDIDGLAPVYDAFGNQCWDATPTWGSGGFDFDAIGVIHAVP